MARRTIDALIEEAAAAPGPGFPPEGEVSLGGVDPLGLRQINFDLMDQVLPGLNNTARRIRPFVVTAWAWRRAAELAEAEGRISVAAEEELRDFVDRIEVIYAWSQLLMNRNAELPGRQVLQKLVASEAYTFGGDQWGRRREERRNSTAFGAAIFYGPGLKNFGWARSVAGHPGVLAALESARPALDAFEGQIQDRLGHAAFSQLGVVTVSRAEIRSWGPAWSLDSVTDAERRLMSNALAGDQAPPARRAGVTLTLAAANARPSRATPDVREAMCEDDALRSETQTAWKRVQVRQLFRLALEAQFRWTVRVLSDGPRTTEALVAAFLSEASGEWDDSTTVILSRASAGRAPVTARIAVLEGALSSKSGEALAILASLAFCLAQEDASPIVERTERLPLARARKEAHSFREAPFREFLSHVFQSWVMAQHTYSSVARGLADARSGGKQILRLRIVLDEGGWACLPGAKPGSAPVPTPDRLDAVLSLLRECGLLE